MRPCHAAEVLTFGVMVKLTLARAVALAVAIWSVGCSTTKQTTKHADAENAEYTYVTETGSRIPTKVKKGKPKSDRQNMEQGDSRTLEQMQQDQVRRTMRRDGS